MIEPAGSRAVRRAEAKRGVILEAALTVFLREGYAGASVDAIAATAGVGKQTVYAHFGDKEQLFLATVRDSGSRLEVEPSGPLPYSGDVRADLREAGVRILKAVLAPNAAALHRLTIAEITRHPELQRLWRENASGDVVAGIADYLADRDGDGTLAVPDPRRAARQFVLLLATEGRVRSLHGAQPLAEEEYRKIADESADLIVRAHRAAG
jgi:TetR/AcrR family transcriptional repressor of mexJK operon